jgi:hypothetical protein
METPSNHHGMLRPDKKKSAAFLFERQAAAEPMTITDTKNPIIITQSRVVMDIILLI